MSEELSHNGHVPREGSDERESLPPAIQALHTRLLQDGATFRASLPDVARVTRHALLLVNPDDSREVGHARDIVLDDSPEARQQAILHNLARPRHRTRRLPAVAATLAIVGLLAALFATLASGRFAAAPVRPPHSAVHRVTGGAWTDLRLKEYPSSSDTVGGQYVAAPGDPRVVYYIGIYVDDQARAVHQVFTRLDEGQRWIPLRLPLPSLTGSNFSGSGRMGVSIGFRLDVMPTNPYALLLTLDVQGIATCPTPLPQFAGCFETLYSPDGGTHWRSPRLPDPGLPALQLVLDNGTVYRPYWSQDGRLYTTVSQVDPGYTPTGVRLITSTDNGASWHYADGDLAAQGQLIYEYVPTAHGATLYAVTQAAGHAGPRTLWRSDDAGADWTLVGPMPGETELIGVAAGADRGAPMLYRDQQIPAGALSPGSRTNVNLLLHPEVSVDGGRAWKPLPLTGLPTSTEGDPYTVGTLSDGSLVAALHGKAWGPSDENGAADLTFYAWAPGDITWRRLAPAVSNLWLDQVPALGWWLIPDTASSPERLCISGVGGDIRADWGVECSMLA